MWKDIQKEAPPTTDAVLACFKVNGKERVKMLRYFKKNAKWMTDDVMPIEFNYDIKYWMEAPTPPVIKD